MNRFKVGCGLLAVVAACSGGEGGATSAGDAAAGDGTGSAHPPSPSPTTRRCGPCSTIWRTGVGAFGATLSLRVPGHGDVHVASGVDDRDPETPMGTGGTYAVASVTKTFVAATALQLVEEGRLSLDEPVAPWLPELPTRMGSAWRCCSATPPAWGEWEWDLGELRRSFTRWCRR